jgi:squalene synthase HpnC
MPAPEQVMARAAGENFTVASRLLPARVRRHLLAFYGFARLTDEIGDALAGDRRDALDRLEAETRRALSGGPSPPLVAAAAGAVNELGLDPAPLFDLIAANRMDQEVTRYRTFEDLVAYCRLSANPVGRLVLGAFGADPGLVPLSDSICTGLQLAEHCQDVAEDARAGRVYLPLEDLDRFGVDPSELTHPGPAPDRLRALMAFEVWRARTWLAAGRPLVRALGGRPGWAVAAFLAGGQAALDAIAARGFDVLEEARRPPAWRVGRRLASTLRGAP